MSRLHRTGWVIGSASLVLAATVAATLMITGTASTPTRSATVYRYAGRSAEQSVRVVTPPFREAHAPWVMTIHGGAWAYGNPAEETHAADVLAAAGYDVFNISYRSTRDVPWAAQWSDVDAAWRWIRARAGRFGIDPDRGAVYGFSAGGQLAAILGNRERSVRAVVSVSGPLEPWQLAWDADRLGGRTAFPDEQTVYGWAAVSLRCPYTPTNPDCRFAWSSFYPSSYLSAAAPPTLMFAGTADETVPDREAEGYADLLTRRHVPNAVVLARGAYHEESAALDGGPRQRELLHWLHTYDAVRPSRA